MKSTDETRAFWDEQAATFDDEADHGFTDPVTRAAWASLLDGFLPNSTSAVIDLGCGTGSVSALLAQRGHRVFGVDLAPKMVERARAKAHDLQLEMDFVVGDVLTAQLPSAPIGAVLSRHLLWAVADPEALVARWSAPLTADGVFIAIEGVWNQSGTPPESTFAALERHFEHVAYTDLSSQDALWGKHVTDLRYAIVGRHPRARTTET